MTASESATESLDPVLLDLMEEGVVAHGPDGRVVSWNAAAGRILDVPASQLAGSLTLLPGFEIVGEDGRPLNPDDEPARVVLRTGEPCRAFPVRFRRPGGQITSLRLSAAPWPSREPGPLAGALTVIADVTEQRSAEHGARGAHRMEALGRLAGSVAHDFNNLLMAIQGYNDLLLCRLGAADPRRGEAEQIGRAAQRAAGLTRQLLAFSRQQVLELELLDLSHLLTDMQPMLRRLVGSDVELSLETALGVGLVRADRTQMEQIVLNLVINARDAVSAGGVIRIATTEVELDRDFVDAHPGSRPGHHVQLLVDDNGCGMDEATQARIFEPFFTTKAAGQGTGLGLATVYGIVKQSAGYVDVQSAPGRGTTFRIYLPCAQAVPREADAPPAHEAAPNGTILLVEDDDLVRELLREMLAAQGYAVIEESDGGRALALLERQRGPVAALVTDMRMQGMAGPELARRARRLRPGIPVLYLTGDPGVAVEDCDGVPFLVKPFGAEALAEKLRELVSAPQG